MSQFASGNYENWQQSLDPTLQFIMVPLARSVLEIIQREASAKPRAKRPFTGLSK